MVTLDMLGQLLQVVLLQTVQEGRCIWMFDLDFEDEEQLDAPLVLSGGSPGGLGEIDVHSMTIESDGTQNGGFLYALTGEPQTMSSRIVKIEIGGSDVADSCTSGCFRRVASFLASEPTSDDFYS